MEESEGTYSYILYCVHDVVCSKSASFWCIEKVHLLARSWNRFGKEVALLSVIRALISWVCCTVSLASKVGGHGGHMIIFFAAISQCMLYIIVTMELPWTCEQRPTSTENSGKIGWWRFNRAPGAPVWRWSWSPYEIFYWPFFRCKHRMIVITKKDCLDAADLAGISWILLGSWVITWCWKSRMTNMSPGWECGRRWTRTNISKNTYQ